MEEKNMIIKVTKSYSRKVNLSGVSSRYDNIELGTYVTAQIEFKNQEEFDKKSNILAEKVKRETERDIASAIQSLMDMAKDEKNSALVGLGDQLSNDSLTSQIDGFDDIVIDEKKLTSLPSDLDEIDLGEISID